MSERKRRVKLQKGQRCPLCREAMTSGGLSVCPRCKTLYHRECLEELSAGSCSIPGCKAKQPAAQAAPPQPEVSRTPLPAPQVTNAELLRLRRAGDSELYLEPGLSGFLFVLIFLAAALGFGWLLWTIDAPTALIAMGPGFLLFLASFAGAIACANHASQPRMRVDLEAGSISLSQGGKQPAELSVAEVAALQFLSAGARGARLSEFFQVCLVLHSGRRRILLNSPSPDSLFRFGAEVAEFLGVELLDHS